MRLPVGLAILSAVLLSLTSCTSSYDSGGAAPTQREDVPHTDYITAGGRTLLIASGFNGDHTDYSGALGQSAAHCITIGTKVVLAPANAKLFADGSIVLSQHTWKPGTIVHVGGVPTPAPPKDTECKAPTDGYWTASATWR